jgi:hypothetical protein
MSSSRFVAALVLAGACSGCTYYVAPDGVAYPASTRPASFDRSFAAASSALLDQGFAITAQDRASGTVVGSGGGGTLTARVQSQADGSVRVQFDANGMKDPGAIDRVSRAYDQRMGR